MVSYFLRVIYLGILIIIFAVNTGAIIIITVILIYNSNISNSLSHIDRLYYLRKSPYN